MKVSPAPELYLIRYFIDPIRCKACGFVKKTVRSIVIRVNKNMANPEHLRLLRCGVQEWNEWRNQNSEEKIDFSNAHLAKLNLVGADLSRTNLTSALFYRSDLKDVDFIRASLSNVNFSEANLANAIFYETNLSGANFSGANLEGATFMKAKLSSANFSRANLSSTNFTEANLSYARFTGACAFNTNFECAYLTQACIEDWQINHETNFKKTICDYIYLKTNSQSQLVDRYPSDPSQIFALGEFTKFIQIGLNTIELVFDKEIDWIGFFAAFQDLKQKFQPEEFSIKTFEKALNGRFIIRVNVPCEANKLELESEFYQKYQDTLQRLNSPYQEQFLIEYPDIEAYRQQGINFEEIIQRLANHPIPKNLSIAEPQVEQ